MRKYLFLTYFLCSSYFNHAQKQFIDTGRNETELQEVVISANKFVEKKRNIAQKIEVITSKQIARFNVQNTGDLLTTTGNVFVQKSQQGGSSPVIRGFEASRVLLVIDGIRMNNAIYRSGHLQNIITVDQNMLERVEIIYGPASTIYGSDALGGVVHLITKSPKHSDDKKFLFSESAFTRYSSANNEKTLHADASIGGKRFAWLQSYTFSNFGDTKTGRDYPSKYPDFGRRSQYISTINGVDSVVKNSDDRIQRFSGYEQWDITQKLLFRPTEKISHSVNLQLSNTNNIPRYDRLQDVRNGTLRYAEWSYGPQKRILGAYELLFSKTGFFDHIRANVNYQDIEESRHTREYRRYDRLDSRMEHIKVWGFTVDGRKAWENNELTVGIDGQLNNLSSTATRRNIQTGSVSKLDTRYPNGKNNMNYYAAYAQHLYKFAGNKFILNDGVRFQAVNLHSTIVDNSFFNLPYTDIKQNNFSVTGNVGLVYLPAATSKVTLSLASGFRAPNIDDLSRIFESSTAARQIVVPNPNIKPEYTYNTDISYTQLFTKNVKFELSGFYTWFNNAIIQAPFQLNGQDSIVYNGVKSQVLANQNRNKAYVYGFNAGITVDLFKYFSVFSTITYTKGRFIASNNEQSSIYQKQSDGTYKLVRANVSSRPLDHIPPLFGKTSIQFAKNKFNAEIFALYNGWKRLDQYNATGEDNAQYATEDGTPAWITLNVKGKYSLNKNIHFQFEVDNIFDRNYRYFASGFSAPGRNFIFSVRAGR